MKNDLYSFSFYKNMIERMKNHKDALKPDDELANHVSFKFLKFFFFLLTLKILLFF